MVTRTRRHSQNTGFIKNALAFPRNVIRQEKGKKIRNDVYDASLSSRESVLKMH